MNFKYSGPLMAGMAVEPDRSSEAVNHGPSEAGASNKYSHSDIV